jgi:hypothetical protein
LIEHLHGREVTAPVVVYTSAPTLARVRAQALAAGAHGATASGTELLDMLGRLGCLEDRARSSSNSGAPA